MREIKFRGKGKYCEYKDKWLYGYLYVYGKPKIYSILNENDVVTLNEFLGSCVPAFINVDPETIGQYTGLKDKNGVEIYEGDLIKTDYASGIWVVAFDERYTCVSLFEAKQLSDKYIALSNRFQYDYEVVGNIYDNPELLF